ncbi:MAG: protein usg [Alphaproteobacteria bacterium CG_4_10_14_0_8_um_filter_37_21]|nr:MAG: protein usg [Alphaproteobacteria bacterium CG_4_10_14_0_8_um_filter_37_21]
MPVLNPPNSVNKIYDTSDFSDALEGCALTTAEIFYHLPDHPVFIQSYLWQDFDLPPTFPRLTDFLIFWGRSIDGKLHSVRIAIGDHLVPNDLIAKVIVSL